MGRCSAVAAGLLLVMSGASSNCANLRGVQSIAIAGSTASQRNATEMTDCTADVATDLKQMELLLQQKKKRVDESFEILATAWTARAEGKPLSNYQLEHVHGIGANALRQRFKKLCDGFKGTTLAYKEILLGQIAHVPTLEEKAVLEQGAELARRLAKVDLEKEAAPSAESLGLKIELAEALLVYRRGGGEYDVRTNWALHEDAHLLREYLAGRRPADVRGALASKAFLPAVPRFNLSATADRARCSSLACRYASMVGAGMRCQTGWHACAAHSATTCRQ